MVQESNPPLTNGYTVATPDHRLAFPADHGPHPEYLTEWWYYTGNLTDGEGSRFGYQLTFFRRALQPAQHTSQRESGWATSQAYMAHFALTDVRDNRHQAVERLARGAAGLAGAQASPYMVWLEDWQVIEKEPGVYELHAAQENGRIDLILRDRKGPILHGEDGYSQKGPDPGNASFYYSLTRLDTDGTIQIGEKSYQVNGASWMDHEFSTSALSPGQIGWDWFSIQLDDGREIMLFQIRREDSSVDPFSSGTVIQPDGATSHLTRDDFNIVVDDTWRSTETGATYPASWTVEIPGENLRLEIEPLVANQELILTYDYWEGAVRINAVDQSQDIEGYGYVELTGYAGSMSGEF